MSLLALANDRCINERALIYGRMLSMEVQGRVAMWLDVLDACNSVEGRDYVMPFLSGECFTLIEMGTRVQA